MVRPTDAGEIGLPVYRADGPFLAPAEDGFPFTWSWSFNAFRVGRQTDEVTFYYQGISCGSVPHYRDAAWYEAKFDRDAMTGDWRVDNFLRSCLRSRDDETAVDWEARVTQLWQVAGHDKSWRPVELNVDGSQVQARSLTLEGQIFVRARMPWGDLQVGAGVERWLPQVALQRMTVEELQFLLDDHNARLGH